VLAPLSAAQYAWIVLHRIHAQQGLQAERG
jgi:hypothetical protein